MRGQIYIIAEAGVNHNGSVDLAKGLILAAAEAGADAVKFQTFRANRIASVAAQKAAYQKETTGNGGTQLSMLRALELPEEAYPELLSCCRENRIDFLSTPFDADSLQFLIHQCHVRIVKVPSGEATNDPFLLEVARTHLPVILSTGMCTLGEVERALSVLAYGYTGEGDPPCCSALDRAYAAAQEDGTLARRVSLLHCTSEYPAPWESIRLKAMDTLGSAFGLPVGYSDHSEGIEVSLAAAARGAAIIEKHFTLDRSLPGPDHRASLEPEELARLVSGIRHIELALGNGVKAPTARECDTRTAVRKSIVAACSIRKGEPFTKENLTFKRPGTGKSPAEYWSLLGTAAGRCYEPDELL